MSKSTPILSKSRFISGNQCHLRLWNDTHAGDLATESGSSLQAVFDTGHEVGELACQRFPGGNLVAQNHFQITEALTETKRLLNESTATSLFEAAFVYQGFLARVDILERLPTGGWRLIEVKSSTKLKEVFVLDVTFQLLILRGVGLDVRDAAVMTLDRTYVYDGQQLDLDRLFMFHPVLDQCEALLDEVNNDAQEMLLLIANSTPPDIEIGEHCFTPYECPYYGHCTENVVFPDHGVEELPRLSRTQRSELEEAEINEIRDIPAKFPLRSLQSVVRQAVVQQEPIVHGDLAAMLAPIELPVRFLDFETFAPAIPRFAGTSPYDAIPFLFSVHTENETGKVSHLDYLHETDDDPRKHITERLIQALGDQGSICVYSSYEKTTLNKLIVALPERTIELTAIIDRLVDLLPIVRNSIYYPEFRGSFSIKSVLPVLVPDLGYDDLEIADGQAAACYMQALNRVDASEREEMFDDLGKYCERDTYAMVGVVRALRRLASTH